MSKIIKLTSITQIREALRNGDVSAKEIVDEYLYRISNLDKELHSYVYVMAEDAYRKAEQLDKALATGKALGPLHGVPVAIKDIFETVNAPTTMGSRAFENYWAANDSFVIKALNEAGAIILGKLNMDEFALGVTGTNALFPRCVNPIDRSKISGGSSSGCACATAASLCTVSIGTDTAGSVRVPASLCGVVGLKPTYGRISKNGVMPLSWSLDHVGLIARNVSDVWLTLQSIAGPDPTDPCSVLDAPELEPLSLNPNINGLKIGLALDGLFSGADEEIMKAVKEAALILESHGAKVQEIHIDTEIPGGIITTEGSVIYSDVLAESKQMLGDRVRKMLEVAQKKPVWYYANARNIQNSVKRTFELALASVDIVISPTTKIVAPAFSDLDVKTISKDLTAFTGPINLTGLPALTVPCGSTDDGLPIGLQIIGKKWDEWQVCSAGQALENALTI